MEAHNGFRRAAWAANWQNDGSHSLEITGTHTWHDDRAQSASGQVAGQLYDVNGESYLSVAGPLETAKQARLLKAVAAELGRQIALYCEGGEHAPEALAVFGQRALLEA